MHRIDTKTAQKDKFGAGKNGFTRGNPQTGTPATDLDDDYFDMLQEELCSVVEASGASLEKGRHDQLLTALRALLLSRKNPFGDIKSDGTVQTALENLGLGEATFGAQNCAVFDNAGVSTWNVPDIVKKGRRVRVKVIGGGGSGGYPSISSTNAAGGGGGGGGGVSESVIDLTGIDTVTITVGSGGNGQNTSARNGNPGGTSSFGTYLSATGGYGGGQISGGVGGEGVGGQINTSLGPGSPGASMIAGTDSAVGGSGGGPGGHGQVLDSAGNVGSNAKGPGGGGAGLATKKTGGVTGAGHSGIVIIYW
ncbi:hypothetical protein KYK43_001047 [Escherichia coli]|nr:hypothetical protein [Escherichia coli]EFG1505391.1 hypothetical protein [Escherichia coli]EFG7397466.1 hypothetical protein [Escherichia coli]EFI4451021.1 hypothetical protein [Escherichia coli]EGL0035404.1 hypothetical protein [Escherichia coli]